jgi:hypothetical protein
LICQELEEEVGVQIFLCRNYRLTKKWYWNYF